MKKGIWLLFVIILSGKFLCAQSTYRRPEMKIDTNYVDSYYKDLIVRLYTADKGNLVLISDRINDLSVKYRSNDHFKVGMGVNYKWFGLKIGAEIPFVSTNENKYGRSSSLGLQSYLIARRFIVDVVALKTHGYYLTLHGRNSDELTDNDLIYQIRKDIQTTNVGVNFIYVLNYQRFSYKAAFNQTDLQLKSAGSIIFGGGVSSFKIQGDSVLIAQELTSEYFKDWQGLYNFHSYGMYGSAGYAYSYVPFRKAIITCSLMAELGMRYNNLKFDTSSNNSQTKPGLGGEVRISGGYHFPGFYLGASFVQTQFNSDVRFNSLQIANGTSFLEFTVSKRIKL